MSLLAVAAAACSALLAFGGPPAIAAPASDGQGYTDSTARCASPSTAVVFGSTAGSRVAICKSSDGTYQYRGVRVSDGAKLIIPAKQSSTGGFTAVNDGITYNVTSSSLTVTADSGVIRQEAWVDFHGSAGTKTPTGTSAPTATAGATATSAPSATATATATVTATATPSPTTPATPLPPPLPAEVGGGSSR